MKNLRYQLLNNYIGNKLIDDSIIQSKSDSILERIHILQKKNIISLEVEEIVINALYEFSDLLIKILSNCEFIEFNINQNNDNKQIKELSMFY